MNEIGTLLKETREKSGVTIKEASEDLEIKELILENIEDGNIGCFKDIFVLKEYISTYSKYLGLNSDKIINEFNEYLFEYTSKIPTEELEKQVKVKNTELEKTMELKNFSPYTMPNEKKNKKRLYVLIGILVGILVLIVAIWSIIQITVNDKVANRISVVGSE